MRIVQNTHSFFFSALFRVRVVRQRVQCAGGHTDDELVPGGQ